MKYKFLPVIAFILVLGATFTYSYQQYKRTNPAVPEQVFLIESGASFNQIANQLRGKDIISSFFWFKLWARLLGKDRHIKAGEYLIPAYASPKTIMDTISSGLTIGRKITFKEGLTGADIVQQLTSAQGLKGQLTIIPENGTLLPETYYYDYGDLRENIIKRMQSAMKEKAESLWQTRDANLPFKTLNEAKVLASIIEREGASSTERPYIASVFINRLKKGMKLQSDPTVIFALTGGNFDLGRPVIYKDLSVKSPFNTYHIKGLPPLPICNFSAESLKAVLNPAKTNFLYFVVDPANQEKHLFSKTYQEHLRKSEAFLKVRRADRKKQSSQKPLPVSGSPTARPTDSAN